MKKKEMTINEFAHYVKHNPVSNIRFQSDNQPDIRDWCLDFDFVFEKVIVFEYTNGIGLENNNGLFRINTVRRILVEKDNSIPGWKFTAICAASFDDEGISVVFTAKDPL